MACRLEQVVRPEPYQPAGMRPSSATELGRALGESLSAVHLACNVPLHVRDLALDVGEIALQT